MNRTYEDEELPLPLLKRSRAKARTEAEEDNAMPLKSSASRSADRMRPATAGLVMGLLAGAAGLGVVHAIHPTAIGAGITRLASRWTLPLDAALPAAYLAVALGGAIVGIGFASVTRHLRRFVPLLVWAQIFFVSLTMLVLAMSSAYGRGLGVSMAPAILAASVAYAFVVSFQLPMRKRR